MQDLFHIEMFPDLYDMENKEDGSLMVLLSIWGHTLCFASIVLGTELHFLVDLGAIDYFIDLAVTNDMCLPLYHALLTITLASGERVTSHSICCQLPVIISNNNFIIDIRNADLPDDVDIILGTP